MYFKSDTMLGEAANVTWSFSDGSPGGQNVGAVVADGGDAVVAEMCAAATRPPRRAEAA